MKAQPSSDTSSSSSKAGRNAAAAAAAAVPAGLVPRSRCLDAVAAATEGYSGSDLMELAAQVGGGVRGVRDEGGDSLHMHTSLLWVTRGFRCRRN
jgi:hypothetical protein